MTTLRLRLTGATMSVGVLAALLALGCGGSSTSSDDDDGGSGGSSMSSGGTSSNRGGSSNGVGGSGASGGSAATGGSGATGGTGGTGMIAPIGDCEDFVPCGGDPEGVWRVTDVCTELATSTLFPAAGCENALTGFDADVDGTYTFSNGVVTFEGTVAYQLTLEIDDVCASSLADTGGVPAALLCPLIEASYADAGAESASCDTSTGNCVCVLSFPAEPSMSEPQTYTISGNQLVTSDGASTDFCEQGETLGLHSRSAPGEDPQISLTFSLERE